jgi:hypothetical protein
LLLRETDRQRARERQRETNRHGCLYDRTDMIKMSRSRDIIFIGNN